VAATKGSVLPAAGWWQAVLHGAMQRNMQVRQLRGLCLWVIGLALTAGSGFGPVAGSGLVSGSGPAASPEPATAYELEGHVVAGTGLAAPSEPAADELEGHVVAGTGLAAPSEPAAAELEGHVESMLRQVADAKLPLARRAVVVLELGGTLDRAARSSSSAERRETLWTRAIAILDRFLADHPQQPRRAELQLQAAVYRWAQGRSWLELVEADPGEGQAIQRAIAALDEAIERLRELGSLRPGGLVGENLSFRLAQALADRAKLDPRNSPARSQREQEALDALAKPLEEPVLGAFAALLRADLKRRLGSLDEAARELAAATTLHPELPDRERLEVEIPLLLAEGEFSRAIQRVRSSQLEEPSRQLWIVRIRLAEHKKLGEGSDRLELEQELFRAAAALRQSGSPLAAAGLGELARARIEPDPRHQPEVWELLALAADSIGDRLRASELMLRAATAAEVAGQSGPAGRFRLRAAAFRFQAGDYLEADRLLEPLIAPGAPAEQRTQAALLQALARGRAVAAGVPGATLASYTAALERHIREFPDSPLADESRWLLGRLVQSRGESERALQLWGEIASGSERWLEARLGSARLMRDRLEPTLPISDRTVLAEAYQKAEDFLKRSLETSRQRGGELALELELARLQLLPIVGSPQQALAALNRVLERSSAGSSPHYRARLLRLVAWAINGRYVEAERDASEYPSWRARSEGAGPLAETVRLLDRTASLAESDLLQRRCGLLLRLLLEPILQEADRVQDAEDPTERSWEQWDQELRLRLARAHLFMGDDRGALTALHGWTGPPDEADDTLLRDLADTYSRLDAHELAIDVQRLRCRKLPSASPLWFDARYGLALAHYRAGRNRDAAQLIDAAAILYPDLGGGQLQRKFIRLRQRLGIHP
jgi:hypothetical protein